MQKAGNMSVHTDSSQPSRIWIQFLFIDVLSSHVIVSGQQHIRKPLLNCSYGRYLYQLSKFKNKIAVIPKVIDLVQLKKRDLLELF